MKNKQNINNINIPFNPNNYFSIQEKKILDFNNYFCNNNTFKPNNFQNIPNNNLNGYSFWNNNINNMFNYRVSNINYFIYDNNNNILLNNIMHTDNNNNNYNICNNNNIIFNNINNINNNNIQINNNINLSTPNFLHNQNNSTQNRINNMKVNYNNINDRVNNKFFTDLNNSNKIINNESNNYQQYNLEEFKQYIKTLPTSLVNYLCTSKGILEIQKQLAKSNYDFKLFLLYHLNKNGLTKIMKNKYGNYFFQQLIKNSDKQIKALILSYISDNFINISKDSSGTFSLQALLEEINTIEEETLILQYINNHEIEMIFDKNATHVIQKLVLLFPDIYRRELNEIILNNIIDICLDSNGICLFKNFIKTNTIMSDKNRIKDAFLKNLIILAESPFGNYGIQFLLENCDKNMLNDIKDKIIENIYKLSIQQFSSNVVEKAIEIFEGENKEILIKKILFEGNFLNLLKSRYGIFVLYKAFDCMNIELKSEFEKEIINNINNNKYKNKDIIKINKFLEKINYRKTKNYFNLSNNNQSTNYNNFSNSNNA